MKLRKESEIRLKWLITIAASFFGVYLGFRFVLPLILPFLVAYFLGWVIHPVTEFLYRRLKIPRIIGGGFSLFTLVTAVGIGIFFLMRTLLWQVTSFLQNIPIYLNVLANKLDYLCGCCDDMFGFSMGTVRDVANDNMILMFNKVKTNIVPGIAEHTIPIIIGLVGAIGIILIILIATLLIVKDLPVYKERFQANNLYQDIHKVTAKLADAGVAYLRAQLILVSIVSIICAVGLKLIGNEYALLFGIGIGVFDAFPILGSGLILIPWTIIMLFNGKLYAAAILITTYLFCQIIRQLLEPKLIGDRIGIKPIFTLMAMYVGINLFSFAGFFLGPIGLVIIITIINVIKEKAEVISS